MREPHAVSGRGADRASLTSMATSRPISPVLWVVAVVVVAIALAAGGRLLWNALTDATKAAGKARRRFEATAYSIEGITARGTRVREGVVAADPKILPLGSRIRLRDASHYDGEYLVQDTGPAIRGREIDIYLASDAEAKRFGRRSVTVQVVRYGDGQRAVD
jgi:3D (Asp-Asp-Asp) domain-containing protein